MRACHYHGDRPAIGICMRCRVAICADCSTRLEGVNHCHACLKAMGRREAAPARRRSELPLAATAGGVLAVGCLVLFTLCLLLVGGKFAP